MKKHLFLPLVLLSLLFSACDKEVTKIETWTVASEKGVTGVGFGFGFVPANIIKKGSNPRWELSTAQIEGFVFEEGYECQLRVRIDPIANPPADGPIERYTMEQLISRMPAHSVDKEEFSPQFNLAVASQRGVYYDFPCYWIKDLRYSNPRWEPLPTGIAGFDYEPGYEYTLFLKAFAEKEEDADRYQVRLALIEELAKSERPSEGLPQ